VSELGELRINIPDDVHKALKIKAAEERKTLKKLVIETLKKSVKEHLDSYPPRH